jgi:hypothetical protein
VAPELLAAAGGALHRWPELADGQSLAAVAPELAGGGQSSPAVASACCPDLIAFYLYMGT